MKAGIDKVKKQYEGLLKVDLSKISDPPTLFVGFSNFSFEILMKTPVFPFELYEEFMKIAED